MNSSLSKNSKKNQPFFKYEAYIEADDQAEYIHDLLLVMLHKKKLESQVMCMNELNDILN